MTVRLWLAAVAVVGCGEGQGRDAGPGDGAVTAERPDEAPEPLEIERLDERRYIIDTAAVIQLGIDHSAGKVVVAREKSGYRITGLSGESTAARLGLEKGDLIRGVNNVEMTSPARLQRAWNRARRDQQLELLLERDGAVIERRWMFSRGVEDKIASFRSRLADRDRSTPEYAKVVELARGGLKETGLHRYEIDRAILAALAEHRRLGDRRTAGVWSARGGHRGVTVGGGSIYSAFGIGRFDIVKAVGVTDVRSATDLQDAVGKLAKAADLSISIVRLDEPLILRYTVVEDVIDKAAWSAALAAWSERADRDDPYNPSRLRPRPTTTPIDLSGVKAIDDHTFEVAAEVIDKLGEPSAARSARIVPAIKNGEPDGFKLYAIRRGSLPAALGFKNGDRIARINGLDVSRPDGLLAAYRRIKKARDVTVEIERRGKPVTLTYRVKR